MAHSHFHVAIVGRPNVGKSTLFNRLVGQRVALVDDTPGVTRDRRDSIAQLYDLEFILSDTAGYEDIADESLESRMRQQTELGIEIADIVIFMIDVRAGVTPADQNFAKLLHRYGKDVVMLANKVEGSALENAAYETAVLGFGEPIMISAEHGLGMADLHNELHRHHEAWLAVNEKTLDAPEDMDDDAPSGPIRVAVIGRPNIGKSTLINQMIGEERLLTGDEMGITRDSISIPWQWQGQDIELFDTAGMRRRAKIQKKLEKLSVSDTLRAIRFSHAVILMLDVTQPFDKQDLQIADLAAREGRAVVIALNKWDLISNRSELMPVLMEKCDRLLPQIKGVPMIPVSGLTGEKVDRLMDAVLKAYALWNTRLSTSGLNQWLADMVEHHPPPAVSGRRLKLRYLTQPKTRPPTFALFCSKADRLPTAYQRYLVNNLREDFNMPGIPIRIYVRSGKNPYADKKKSR